MAKYNFTLNSEEVTHKLARELTVEMATESKWTQFMGTGNFSVIKTQNATKDLGSDGIAGTVTMRMRGVLTGSGVEGNEDFDTNSDELQHLYQTISLDNFGNSIKSGDNIRLLKQVHFTNFATDAKDMLVDWGKRKLDFTIYTGLSTACTNVVLCNHHASITPANVVAGDILTVADVREAGRRARKGVDAAGNRVPKLRPIKVQVDDVNGVAVTRKIYIMKVGEDSATNLKKDPEWQALQEAATANNLNSPLFSSKLGVIDDIILINDGTNCAEEAGILTSDEIATYAGTGVKTEINLLLGATAGLMPMDTGFTWYEDKYDNNRKASVAVDRDFGFAKTRFKGKKPAEIASVWHDKDYGVIAVVAAVK